ncbi:hypothetical protein F4820DRAFT_451841 [Hypoxylon rubiginosum]|uniref:Uncharacterized protein n=1 Tax=Hypoxylon rubiginosum TaxID=110542 RepID=A0ACB9YQ87_9PEZI|nr:hypothetical protein F4820DRAFT_451841 [Hypoxylon rubiginosum]
MGVITSLLSTCAPFLAILAAHKAFRFLWTHHARPWAQGDIGVLRYLHGTKGKPAWALVTRAAACDDLNVGNVGLGRALCFELAARGFNVVMHGGDRMALDAMKEGLEREFPWNRYRIVVENSGVEAEAETQGAANEVLVARVADAMEGENLTVLVNNTTTVPGRAHGGVGRATTIATQLTAALIPLLRRNAPSLVVNIASVAAPRDEMLQMPVCASCGAPRTYARDSIDVASYRLGDSAIGDERPSYFRPSPETLACAVLRHAGVEHDGGKGRSYAGAIVPYLPHAVLYMSSEALPEWALGWARELWEKGEELRFLKSEE